MSFPVYNEKTEEFTCPDPCCDGAGIESAEEGYSCLNCFKIWQECYKCTKEADPKMYNIFLECKSSEQANKIVWMKLTGWCIKRVRMI